MHENIYFLTTTFPLTIFYRKKLSTRCNNNPGFIGNLRYRWIGQPKTTVHTSLKQTVHLRTQSEVPAFLRSGLTKESNNFSPFHQRSNSENAANYLPYSPYAYRRKEISRPFSPPVNSTEERDINYQRSYSPYRQHLEINRDRVTVNGQHNR